MEIKKTRTVDPFFEDAINKIFTHSHKTAFVMDGPLGLGKALANSEQVLTPKGFIEMGLVKKGDLVISQDGESTKVTGVHPQGLTKIYKVSFKNGNSVRCTLDHLWKVRCIDLKGDRVVTTGDILKRGFVRHSPLLKQDGTPQKQYLFKVPLVGECKINNNEKLSLDPYLMGALLGDGGFTYNAISFTNGNEEVVTKVESLLPNSVKFTKTYQSNAWHCSVRGVKKCHNIVNKYIRQMGLWGKYSYEKHIPEEYINSSLDNRKQLIQGLIDTDGHILKTGNVEYNTSSKQLMEDYCRVAKSIGMELGSVTTKIPTYTYKDVRKKGRKSYRVVELTKYTGWSTITDIQPDGEELSTCITVEHPSRLFVTNGYVLTHNSSNFVMQGAYNISQLVTPIRKGNRLVRESKWAAVRESENSALSTIIGLFGESIFTPEIMALDNSPVQVYGSHPAKVLVTHDLPDGTILEMRIECHGFNNEAAHNRLRTHEFLGALIFEMQGIPFNIFEVTQERCGRFRTSDLTISKVIKGKKYTLSGLSKLAMVLCDVNIPERPHPLYKEYYDKSDKSKIPYMFITPPSPLLYKPVSQVGKEMLDKYPVTRFEGEEVVWFPNPACYNMTRHFEEKDEDGNNIPWTGYTYWFNRLHRTDSEVRRYVLGKPDTVGGESAVYHNFKRDDATITSRKLVYGKPVYIGYDPGGYAAVVLCQLHEGKYLHFFKEFIFEPSDGVSTRKIFSDYVFPWCRDNLTGYDVVMIPDPASSWLGKSIMAGQTESVINMFNDEVRVETSIHTSVAYKIEPCMVSNQDTKARLGSLGYFIDQGKLTVDACCNVLIDALSGGYRKKKLKSGIISDTIDKDNPYSHPAEAAQYPAVNILNNIKKSRHENRNKNTRSIFKVKRTR